MCRVHFPKIICFLKETCDTLKIKLRSKIFSWLTCKKRFHWNVFNSYVFLSWRYQTVCFLWNNFKRCYRQRPLVNQSTLVRCITSMQSGFWKHVCSGWKFLSPYADGHISGTINSASAVQSRHSERQRGTIANSDAFRQRISRYSGENCLLVIIQVASSALVNIKMLFFFTSTNVLLVITVVTLANWLPIYRHLNVVRHQNVLNKLFWGEK